MEPLGAPVCVAEADFDAEEDGELSLRAGARVLVLQPPSADWLLVGRLPDLVEKGFVPSSFLASVECDGQMLHTFDAEGEGELSIAVGDIVWQLDTPNDEGWVQVAKFNGEHGYVPASFIGGLSQQSQQSQQQRGPKKRHQPTVDEFGGDQQHSVSATANQVVEQGAAQREDGEAPKHSPPTVQVGAQPLQESEGASAETVPPQDEQERVAGTEALLMTMDQRDVDQSAATLQTPAPRQVSSEEAAAVMAAEERQRAARLETERLQMEILELRKTAQAAAAVAAAKARAEVEAEAEAAKQRAQKEAEAEKAAAIEMALKQAAAATATASPQPDPLLVAATSSPATNQAPRQPFDAPLGAALDGLGATIGTAVPAGAAAVIAAEAAPPPASPLPLGGQLNATSLTPDARKVAAEAAQAAAMEQAKLARDVASRAAAVTFAAAKALEERQAAREALLEQMAAADAKAANAAIAAAREKGIAEAKAVVGARMAAEAQIATEAIAAAKDEVRAIAEAKEAADAQVAAAVAAEAKAAAESVALAEQKAADAAKTAANAIAAAEAEAARARAEAKAHVEEKESEVALRIAAEARMQEALAERQRAEQQAAAATAATAAAAAAAAALEAGRHEHLQRQLQEELATSQLLQVSDADLTKAHEEGIKSTESASRGSNQKGGAAASDQLFQEEHERRALERSAWEADEARRRVLSREEYQRREAARREAEEHAFNAMMRERQAEFLRAEAERRRRAHGRHLALPGQAIYPIAQVTLARTEQKQYRLKGRGRGSSSATQLTAPRLDESVRGSVLKQSASTGDIQHGNAHRSSQSASRGRGIVRGGYLLVPVPADSASRARGIPWRFKALARDLSTGEFVDPQNL